MYYIIYDHTCSYFKPTMGFSERKVHGYTHDWLSILDKRSEVYCVFFNFQKAFDTVPHKQLMLQLKQLHLHPQLLQWIHNYLCYRQQSVRWRKVLPCASGFRGSTRVCSRALTFCHLLMISSRFNSLVGQNYQYIYMLMTFLSHLFSHCTDYVSLQSNIDAVYQWSENILLMFNRAQCKCMLISKRKNHTCPTMTLNGVSAEV